MAFLINIPLDDTQNLLSYKSTLSDNPTVNFTSESVSSNASVTSEWTLQKEALSYKTHLFQHISNGLNAQFDFGDALSHTCKRSGNHSFSFYVLKGEINANPNYNVDVKLKVYVDNVLTDTFIQNIDLVVRTVEDFRFVQSFNLEAGNNVNFAFEVEKPSVENPNPNIELYFTGFQLNFGEVTNYQLPTQALTGWRSIVDTTNTQALTANVSNTIAFTGIAEQNGGLVLLNSNAKITPIKVGDFIVVDFAFTAVTPSGSGNYLTILFDVNGFAFRSEIHTFLKGAGNDDNISVSYGFPVTADFVTYGGVFKIIPNTAVIIKNRYISVARTHKGV